jgi:D-aminopeptidase
MTANTRSFYVAAVIAAASLFGSITTAAAGVPCGMHDGVAKGLAAKYKETRRIMGVLNAAAVMEIFMSPQGTWTVLVTDTNGMSCVIAAGQDWQEIPVAVAGLDS